MKEYTVRVGTSGNRFWRNKDGRFHCEHGPAVEYSDGRKEYWLNNKLLTQEEWEKLLKKPCSGKVVLIEGVPYKLVEV